MRLQPGRTSSNKRPKNDTFNPRNRFMWVRTAWHQLTINVPWADNKQYQRVLFTLTRGTNQATTIDLTSLTLPELLALRECITVATEVAEPIVKALDDAAKDKANAGDDSDPRVYRRLPEVAIRAGTLGQHDPLVFERRKDVLQGVGAQFMPGSVPPQPGSGLDEREQEESEAED